MSNSIADQIVTEATTQGVDPLLALEVATQESALDPTAVSPKGAVGVFQLMPATAAGLGVDPTDPAANIFGGVSYLSQLQNQFGDPVAALAAYNWGPGNVSNAMATWGAAWFAHIPASVQNYVTTILGNVSTQYQVQFAPAAAGQSAGQAISYMLSPNSGASSTGPDWLALAVAAGIVLLLFAAL